MGNITPSTSLPPPSPLPLPSPLPSLPSPLPPSSYFLPSLSSLLLTYYFSLPYPPPPPPHSHLQFTTSPSESPSTPSPSLPFPPSTPSPSLLSLPSLLSPSTFVLLLNCDNSLFSVQSRRWDGRSKYVEEGRKRLPGRTSLGCSPSFYRSALSGFAMLSRLTVSSWDTCRGPRASTREVGG